MTGIGQHRTDPPLAEPTNLGHNIRRNVPSYQWPHCSIPSAGALGAISLGIPHQNSTYMELQLCDHSSTQYDYIYESHIAYSHIGPLGLAVAVSFCPHREV